jgi:hypothetical protein
VITVGFFSFNKFLMYKDLDPRSWPEGRRPSQRAVVCDLLEDGFGDTGPTLGESERLDEHVDLSVLPQVKDADSSQTLALLEVQKGRNLLIQGPPGTGKSQTITNTIAQAIAAGRRVLFVSEKLAALEVVKRRLDEVGLGDACLELHSHKTNKKVFLEELKHTLSLGRPVSSGSAQDGQALRKARDRLNAYCLAVNEPIGASLSIHDFPALKKDLDAFEVLKVLQRIPRQHEDVRIPARLDESNVLPTQEFGKVRCAGGDGLPRRQSQADE